MPWDAIAISPMNKEFTVLGIQADPKEAEPAVIMLCWGQIKQLTLCFDTKNKVNIYIYMGKLYVSCFTNRK